jgi:anaerobic C4-dicarboxylate transporter
MRFKLSDEETLLSSNKKKQLLLECIVCLLHPQYFLHNVELHAYNSIVDIYTVSKWNDVMTVASMARVVLICSFAITMTGVSSNRAKRIALMHGYEQDYTNIIKTLTKESPFKAVILASLVSIPLFAFCLRICER